MNYYYTTYSTQYVHIEQQHRKYSTVTIYSSYLTASSFSCWL